MTNQNENENKVNKDELLKKLVMASQPQPTKQTKGLQPGFTTGKTGFPDRITTPPTEWLDGESDYIKEVQKMGIPLPEHLTLVLVEAVMKIGESWSRDKEDIGKKYSAYTEEKTSWQYKFKVVEKNGLRDDDYEKMIKMARNALKPKKVKPKSDKLSLPFNLADLQSGKVDVFGGSADLIERSEFALSEAVDLVKKIKPKEILIIDPGDSTEGFESSPNAQRTNDLQQTEQIRVWRRILWSWISTLAPLAPDVKVVGVPSNHCQVRQGKNVVGHANDDWGIEVISQVSDMAEVNPKAYGHVKFITPETVYDEHVVLTLVGGQTLGVIHGHQAKAPRNMVNYVKTRGRDPLAQCDIIIMGHFHHLEVISFGQYQTLFCCPSMDSGSSWFTNTSGEKSYPGVLTFTVDENGWDNMKVIWASQEHRKQKV